MIEVSEMSGSIWLKHRTFGTFCLEQHRANIGRMRRGPLPATTVLMLLWEQKRDLAPSLPIKTVHV
jgi:hypothetical protein